MSDRQQMLVSMFVTPAQAVALNQFFKAWNGLASMGASRFVAFYVDGDGDFRPRCQVILPEAVSPWMLSDDIAGRANLGGDDILKFDYDPVAWAFHEFRDKQTAVVQSDDEIGDEVPSEVDDGVSE